MDVDFSYILSRGSFSENKDPFKRIYLLRIQETFYSKEFVKS